MTWLSGCVAAGSEAAHSACPPARSYSPEFLARAAAEVVELPSGSAVETMLADYSVLRAQARICADGR